MRVLLEGHTKNWFKSWSEQEYENVVYDFELGFHKEVAAKA